MYPHWHVPAGTIIGSTTSVAAAVCLIVEVLFRSGAWVGTTAAGGSCDSIRASAARRGVIHLEQRNGFQRSVGRIGSADLFAQITGVFGPQPDAGGRASDKGEDQLQERWKEGEFPGSWAVGAGGARFDGVFDAFEKGTDDGGECRDEVDDGEEQDSGKYFREGFALVPGGFEAFQSDQSHEDQGGSSEQ